jgi:hypothetical protein
MRRFFGKNGNGRCLAFILSAAAAAVALIPMIMAKNLKGRITESRRAEVAFLEENLKRLPDDVIAVSKGYVINDESALKSIIRINTLRREKANDARRAHGIGMETLELTGRIIDGARASPRLLRNPGFIALNNRFEEISNAIMAERFRCAGLTRKLLRLKSLPIYGSMIEISDITADLCL